MGLAIMKAHSRLLTPNLRMETSRKLHQSWILAEEWISRVKWRQGFPRTGHTVGLLRPLWTCPTPVSTVVVGFWWLESRRPERDMLWRTTCPARELECQLVYPLLTFIWNKKDESKQNSCWCSWEYSQT